MELPNSFSIEHGVKRSDFVDIHFVDLCNFSYFSHGGKRKKVIVLFLGQVKKRNDS